MRPPFLLVAALLAVGFSFGAPRWADAQTVYQSVPAFVQAPGTLGPCAVFQVAGLSTNYVVQTTDSNYEDEFALLTLSQVLGQPVTFTDAGSTVSGCGGYELAQNVQVGNTPCATGYKADFSDATGCDAIAEVYR